MQIVENINIVYGRKHNTLQTGTVGTVNFVPCCDQQFVQIFVLPVPDNDVATSAPSVGTTHVQQVSMAGVLQEQRWLVPKHKLKGREACFRGFNCG